MEKKYYTVNEIANILSLHQKTIQRYIREKKLKANKIGKAWRIEEKELETFAKNLGITQLTNQEPKQIKASTVIDIPISDKERANRIITALNAAMISKPLEYNFSSLHSQYIESENLVRLSIWGNLDFISSIISLIKQFNNSI
ncbi:MAG: helix-turn-helix domain-containing protein [Pleomorphochaeta sp.]